MDPRQFLDLFVSEAREHLEGLSALLLRSRSERLEQEPINDLFRHAHSLKGMAASLGFHPITALAHAVEDLLHDWRERGAPPSTARLDLLVRAADRLAAQVEAAAAGEEIPAESDLIAALAAGAPDAGGRTAAPGPAAPGEAPAPSVPAAPPTPEETIDTRPRLIVEVAIRPGAPLPGARAMVILKRLGDHGRLEACVPESAAMTSPAFDGRFRATLATGLLPDRLAAIVSALPDVAECKVADRRDRPRPAGGVAEAAVTGDSADSGEASAPAEAAIRSESIATVRVSTERMDRLLDGIGELILERERLRRALDPDPGSAAGEVLEGLGRAVGGLRDVVMAMRLMPFAALVPRLQRTVRELARRLDKQVDLAVSGTDIALDRSILEEMIDPLEHILRNGIDHGIEDAAGRRAAGKAPAGRIEIVLSGRDDRVCLQVSDDGRGLDPAALRRVAVDRRFIGREVAERMSDEEALLLITLPGFSTAVRTTEISGRGVGMDVVRTRLQKLGGRLSVRSDVGVGTLFEMDLPPTVTVTRAFLCRAAGEVYAVPVSAVQTTLHVRRDGMLASRGERLVRRDDEVVPVWPLGGLLAGDATPSFPTVFPALVYRVGRRSYALAVDEILGEEEIVVKPLKHPLELLPQYAGAALLNDGRIALILDPANLMLTTRAA
ncbi:MAG TPA: chemotaxis protein CheA [Candidatus Polarisedimenticolia bacterium]|nr:chemotaxis protein CheA [Candidatus Polarisedimenticolia bacterium]